MNNNDILKKNLQHFGLTAVEADIYLYLLDKPAQTILEVTKGTSLPRTTIYDNTQLLYEKGLIERIIEHKSQRIKAYPIEILQSIINQQKDTLKELDLSYKFLKKNIQFSSSLPTTTEVRYYHGATGFKQMMWNALNAKDEHIGYSELGRVDIVGETFIQQWMDEMIQRNIRDRVIINSLPDTIKHVANRGPHTHRNTYQKARSIDVKKLRITGDTTIYNNIFSIAYWKQGEIIGIEIENPELVALQRSLFEIVWEDSIPI